MSSFKALAITPPMTQLNTPYPACAHLVAYLKDVGIDAHQVDLSIELALRLYSPEGLQACFEAVIEVGVPDGYEQMVAQAERYIRVIDPVIRFLQGRESGLATRIVRTDWLPQGPRFAACDLTLEAEAFGSQGSSDHARWLATLMIQDLADCFRLSIAPHFGLTSYGHALAESAVSFDALDRHLASEVDPIEQLLIDLLPTHIPEDSAMVILTAPFPGNVPAALRIAQWLREHRPFCHIAFGGGFANTELRQLSDPRLFDWVDSVLLDDGEEPLRHLIEHLHQQASSSPQLVRTFQRIDGEVRWFDAAVKEPRHGALPAPDYGDINFDQYLDLIDTWNPMQRLWNEGRWLKLIAAHGCYWQRCSFCDTSLPYIADYQPARAQVLAQRMRDMAAANGQYGFHLTDEAAPPRLLVDLALELLRGEDAFHWWGNIRFEKSFTGDRCRLLSKAGMIAVSGGIEVADDEILASISKGVSIPELIPTLKAFAHAGILVHGYLMYGFPGQNEQHTVNSMDLVRQLIQAELLHSGFWHRFTTTAHSPVGKDPDKFGVRITGPEFAGFAWNNLQHEEYAGIDHDMFHSGLVTAMQQWLAGRDLDRPVTDWLSHEVPHPTHAATIVEELANAEQPLPAPDARVVWLGGWPEVYEDGLEVCDEDGQLIELDISPEDAQFLGRLLSAAHPQGWETSKPPTIDQLDINWSDISAWHRRGLVAV